MRIVAIDPGETSAFAIADIVALPLTHPNLDIRGMPPCGPSTVGFVDYTVDTGASYGMPPDERVPNGCFFLSARGHWRGMHELRSVATTLFDPQRVKDVRDLPIQYIERGNPKVIVMEDYRVYPTKLREHIGNPVYTARELGRIEWLAYMNDWAMFYQMAAQAKQLWNNKRLKHRWPTLFEQTRGQAHVRDAIRHLFTYMENNHLFIFFRQEDAI